MRRIMWLGFGAIVVSALASVVLHGTTQVVVTTAPVTTGSIVRQILATGTLQAVTTVDVGSQVSGIIQSLDADYNSIVHAGQVIARLEPSMYEAALRSANAGLQQAESDLARLQVTADDARTKLARATALAQKQLIAESDLEDARVASNEANADVQSGRAAVVEARAAVNQAAVNLSHTIIRSPIDGIVIDRPVDVGQTLAASFESPVLFKIATDLRRMQVRVDVDESDIEGLAPGEPVTFLVDSYPNEVFHGTLLEIRLLPVSEQAAGATPAATTGGLPTTGSGTVVSYTTIIDVANPDEKLRPGMTAEVTLGGSRRDRVIRIPNSALSFRPPQDILDALGESKDTTIAAASAERNTGTDARQVWRYDGQRLTPIAVQPGLADETWTEVIAGNLRPGDALATDAVLRQRRRI